jgi:endonuclease I
MPLLKTVGMSRIAIIITLGTFLMLGCSTDDGGGTKPNPPSEVEMPVAVDDQFTGAENEELILAGMLDNDELVDNARISSVDTETEKGGDVVDNRDGTYTYNPPTDFMGEDRLTYTVCVPGDADRCDTALILITVTDAGEPVAVDDSYETEEDKSLTINNATDNDQLIDNARIISVDDTGVNGTAVLNTDGSILYTPTEGFSGVDTFTYELCDDDETPSCDTAKITVTVKDEGSPVAVDDEVVVQVGATNVVLSNLLVNDNTIDDAAITGVQETGSGSVTLNGDGTVTYNPAAGFEGEDTFTYTICDDDENPTCDTAIVTVLVVQPVAFNIPADLQAYYSGATLSQDPTLLKAELADLTETQHVNKLEYYMRHDYLYDADASFSDPEYVVLMYTGDLRHWTEYQEGDVSEGETFNTEHIYPQSRLASDEAKNDMHHMRVADIEINSLRLNYPFTDGTGDYALVNENSWYPGDEWKGDVARMVMYVHLKYGEPFSDVGTLEMFLKWNVEDPVSAFELQRQEVIEGAQGNRNPFIDNPYFATLIWDGPEAENRWE